MNYAEMIEPLFKGKRCNYVYALRFFIQARPLCSN